MGVNPKFHNHEYYEPIVWKDHARVNDKFEKAAKNGIVIHQKTVDICTLLHHLTNFGPIIILTDGNLLPCDLCKASNKDFLR